MDLKFNEFFSYLPIPNILKGKIVDDNNDKINDIENLSHVNIFTAENNSGKSYIMREIIKDAHSPSYLSRSCIDQINNKLLSLQENLEKELFIPKIIELSFKSSLQFQTQNVLYNYSQFISLFEKLNFKDNIFQRKYDVDNLLSNLQNFKISGSSYITNKDLFIETLSGILKSLSEMLANYIYNKENDSERLDKVYIHYVRSLQHNTSQWITLFNIVNRDYSFGVKLNDNLIKIDKSNNFIHFFSGHDLYERFKKIKLQGAQADRDYKAFQKFIGDTFFQGRDVIISPREGDNNDISIEIQGEKDRFLHEMGTGFQMMIILTYPLFIFKKGFIFIEEPELFLHPGLQRKLIEIYLAQPNFIFFINTHSNHLIDTTFIDQDISIFTIKKNIIDGDEIFKLSNVAYGDKSPYNILGVNNSSIAFSNCTIWVEGITDKIYLKKYIDLEFERRNSDKKYFENIHYSFVFSSGNLISHIDFEEDSNILTEKDNIITKYLTGKAFVVVDNYNKKSRAVIDKIKESLGDNFFELKVPEIENLLPLDAVLNKIIEHPSCKEIDKKSITEKFEQNWDTLRNQFKLGTIIDDHLLIDNPCKRFAVKNDSKAETGNTIKEKYNFSSAIIKYINYNNMTSDAKQLAKILCDFIVKNNS